MRAARVLAAVLGTLAAAVAVVVVSATAIGATPAPAPTLAPPADADVAAGRSLYQTGCSSCHGAEAAGTDRGPTLVGVGAASADFYLSTGRMPLDKPRAQPERRRPAYTPEQIRQLVAYVASLGPGPAIPDVHPDEGNLAAGGRLYADNCAACHSSAGAGGALGHADYAPPLDSSTATQVAEATRIGPGAMPNFGPEAIDEEQLQSIVRYVDYLRSPEDPGGLPMGHLGPIPEGFAAWVVGLGAMLLVIRWIGTRE